MTRFVRTASVCVVLAFALPASGDVTVQGKVVSKDGKPIPGVAIFAIRNGIAVSPAATDEQGKYEILVSGNDEFDLVYDHSAWHLDVIVRLRGNQDISKVLRKVGQEMSYGEAMAALSSYRNMISSQYILRHPDKSVVFDSYNERLKRIRLDQVPSRGLKSLFQSEVGMIEELMMLVAGFRD